MKKIVIIGSTGSIGTQTLKVVEKHRDLFEVVGLVANTNAELLLEQRSKFEVSNCGLFFGDKAKGNDSNLVYGKECYDIASLANVDVVLICASGISALPYVIKAINAKKTIAIANKETLVCAGELIMPLVAKSGIDFLPVDSEHSAIWQCLRAGNKKDVKKLILTASGGAFKHTSIEQLKFVTAEDALKHPNWNMGKKITVDSATMFNKGFEVIEAKWLFDIDIDNIDVVVHQESIIHSMVEFVDSSVIAQMSYPTMEIPIELALAYPNRIDVQIPPLDFVKVGALHFEKLDEVKFPSVDLAKKVAKVGGFYPTVLNSANEVLVDRFLNGEIGFLDIYNKVEKALDIKIESLPMTLENIMYISDKTMRIAKNL